MCRTVLSSVGASAHSPKTDCKVALIKIITICCDLIQELLGLKPPKCKLRLNGRPQTRPSLKRYPQSTKRKITYELHAPKKVKSGRNRLFGIV